MGEAVRRDVNGSVRAFPPTVLLQTVRFRLCGKHVAPGIRSTAVVALFRGVCRPEFEPPGLSRSLTASHSLRESHLEGVSLVDEVLLSLGRVVHLRRVRADQRVEERVETSVHVGLKQEHEKKAKTRHTMKTRASSHKSRIAARDDHCHRV